MRSLICNGIIFIYCILLRSTMEFHSISILFLFVSLTLTFLPYLLPDSGFYYVAAFWISTACFQAELQWYLPSLFFQIVLHFVKEISNDQYPHHYTDSILCTLAIVIPFLCHCSDLTAPLLSGLLFAVLLSCLLAWMTVTYEHLHHRFIHSVDWHTEKQLELEEKNHALLAKQDTEIYAATLKERNRIARDIHDNVGHLLSRSLLMTGAIQTLNTSDKLCEPLSQLDATLNQAMNSIRDSVHNLHDEALNLENTTKQLVTDFQFCPVDLSYDMGYEPPTAIRYAFLSITREALANIIRHSNADHVRIVMREHPSLYQLEIGDNGTRINAPFSENHGLGLTNMQERVTKLHGTMRLYTESGFRIFITIPKGDDINGNNTD